MSTQTNAATAMQAEMPPEMLLMQMVFGSFISQAVYVAAKLGLADLIKDNSQSVKDLAEKTETKFDRRRMVSRRVRKTVRRIQSRRCIGHCPRS